jgi:hypothetical protein
MADSNEHGNKPPCSIKCWETTGGFSRRTHLRGVNYVRVHEHVRNFLVIVLDVTILGTDFQLNCFAHFHFGKPTVHMIR